MSQVWSTEKEDSQSASIWLAVPQALKTIRVARGFTQADVAQLAEEVAGVAVTQSYISKVEQRKCKLSAERLKMFCQVLDCSPDDVLQTAKRIWEYQQLRERKCWEMVKEAATIELQAGKS